MLASTDRKEWVMIVDFTKEAEDEDVATPVPAPSVPAETNIAPATKASIEAANAQYAKLFWGIAEKKDDDFGL